MVEPTKKPDRWTVEIKGMPHFDEAMKRVYAWFENEIIDRPPIRFQAHNAFLASVTEEVTRMSKSEKEAWWFDAEIQVELFLKSIEGRSFHGETFPVYFPNLGPDVYAAFYGAELEFGEVTSWSVPLVCEWDDIEKLSFDWDNIYFKKLEDLTAYALERLAGRALVGYSDLHPGIDCVAAWRDPQQLCFDMIEAPKQVDRLIELAVADFETIYNHFDKILKDAGQLSVSWMGIPSFERMHIPSCDFAALISPDFFERFGMPILQREVKSMTHNVFHVDGKRVAKNIDSILSVPGVHAIQWVQGMGVDYSIMQWVPFIKYIQDRGVPVVVDLSKDDLDGFMTEMDPKGLFLWVATENEVEELEILKRVEKWK
jgi:hypothetical protein